MSLEGLAARVGAPIVDTGDYPAVQVGNRQVVNVDGGFDGWTVDRSQPGGLRFDSAGMTEYQAAKWLAGERGANDAKVMADWKALCERRTGRRPSDLQAIRAAIRLALRDEMALKGRTPQLELLHENVGHEDAYFGTTEFERTVWTIDSHGEHGLDAPNDVDTRILILQVGLPDIAYIQAVVGGRDAYLAIAFDGTGVPRLFLDEGDPHYRLTFWVLDNPDLVDKTPRDVRTRGEIRQRNKSQPDKPRIVTVVDLRASHQAANADVQSAERTYRSRWIVRGHWHNYWTGPIDGERELKRNYVMPYVKGPEGAPLNRTDKISKW